MASATEDEVLRANALFYDAFRDADLDTMEALWSQALPIACIHPGWQALIGRQEVMASWRAILLGANRPDIQCEQARANLLGSTCFVTCVERIGDGALAATNLFVLEEGAWYLVHHQASPIAHIEVNERPPRSSLN